MRLLDDLGYLALLAGAALGVMWVYSEYEKNRAAANEANLQAQYAATNGAELQQYFQYTLLHNLTTPAAPAAPTPATPASTTGGG